MMSESGSTQSNHQKSAKCSMVMQSGDKPFICGLCGCPFTQCGPLERHMRIHTDGKPVPVNPLNDSTFERTNGPEDMWSGCCQDSVTDCQSTALPDYQIADALGCHRMPLVTSETPVKRKVNHRTVQEKYDAIIEVERGVKSKAEIARGLHINSSTLSTWLKYSDVITSKQGCCQDSVSTDCQSTALPDGLSSASNDYQIADALGDHIMPLVTSETPVKRKVNHRTVQEKYDAIIEVERGVKSKAQIARELNINSSTLSTWLKYADAIKQGYETFNPKRRKMRNGKWDELEYVLMEWFKFARDQNAVLSGPILMSKAEQLAERLGLEGFRSTTGWLGRFKERNGIVFRSLYNEKSKDASWIVKEAEIMKTYRSEDIYNVHETSLFFKLIPETMCTIKSPDCCGVKKSKERLTVLVCGNMDGSDKNQMLVVGKDKKPRCLKNVKTLPTYYSHNKNACMTAEIFESWIRQLDNQMRDNGRHIALIVNSASCRGNVSNITNVNLLVLPSNATSTAQALYEGYTQNLKVQYRKRVLLRQRSAFENKRVFTLNVLDAMRFLQQSWHCVMPATTNNYLGFTPTQEHNTTTDEFDDITFARLGSIVNTSEHLQEFLNFDDDAVLTSTTLTNDDSVNSRISRITTPTDQVDSDEEEDEGKCNTDAPTDDQAFTALATLCAYFESLEKTQNESKMLCALSRTIVRQQFSNVEKLEQRTVNSPAVIIKSE